MATLRFHRGSELLFEYRLHAGPNVVGRADSCDVALPGEALSRTHCIIQGRGGSWELADRSRHGVLVDGERVEGRRPLSEGSRIRIGPYTAELQLAAREPRPTAPREPDLSHELLLAAEGGLQLEQVHLEVTLGPDLGRRLVLTRPRAGLGCGGSALALNDPSLVVDHCWVHVSRGRVMLAPGRGAAWLDGSRVRDITPVYDDEEFRVGDSALKVGRRTGGESPQARRFGEMVGESETMTRVFGILRRIAGHHHVVLIAGESGTGKELAARALHEHGPRADRPFVALNCGAISPHLFESELFGHEKGAFTGADQRKDGAFHEADGGTLFLDEVGELPEAAQAKLLRTLETGEVRRVGSNEVSFPDVRILAATNRDLAREVAVGRFREDLFFRLAVLTVEIPPLRQRLGDVPALCRTLCERLDPRATVTPEALEVLLRHSWPGNVRELRNVLTRAYVMGGPRIDAQELSFHHIAAADQRLEVPAGSLDEAERVYLANAVRRHGGNRSAAARELGIARSTLHYKLKKHGLG